MDTRYQGIQFRAGKEPILYMANPDGPCGTGRRALLDKLNALNKHQFEKELDPEIESLVVSATRKRPPLSGWPPGRNCALT